MFLALQYTIRKPDNQPTFTIWTGQSRGRCL